MTNKEFAQRYLNCFQKEVEVILNSGEKITGIFIEEDEDESSKYVDNYNIYIKDIKEMKLRAK